MRFTAATLALVAFATPAAAESLVAPTGLPPATAEMLREMRLGPEALTGLDQELALPGGVMAAAAKEGSVRIRLTVTDKQFRDIERVFNGRYPQIKLDFAQGIGRERAMQPLLAFKAGNLVTDVVTGFVPIEQEYRNLNALEDLRSLPGFANMPQGLQAPDGIAVSFQLNYWCTAYNTKKAENRANLPKTWDDLLTNAYWRGGPVGLVNRPHLWITNLYGVYGDAWTDDYMSRVFSTLKPQLRKESGSGMMKLLGLGEFELMFPAADSLIKREVGRGLPIAFHCPDPVPATDVNIGIFKGSPSANAARVFVNWALSKEGQLAAYKYAELSPAHVALTGQKALMAFPDEIVGKKIAFRNQAVAKETPRIIAAWNKLWLTGGGPSEGQEN
jgi:ABC-type Fe3+ transport system substrate-binding protein